VRNSHVFQANPLINAIVVTPTNLNLKLFVECNLCSERVFEMIIFPHLKQCLREYEKRNGLAEFQKVNNLPLGASQKRKKIDSQESPAKKVPRKIQSRRTGEHPDWVQKDIELYKKSSLEFDSMEEEYLKLTVQVRGQTVEGIFSGPQELADDQQRAFGRMNRASCLMNRVSRRAAQGGYIQNLREEE